MISLKQLARFGVFFLILFISGCKVSSIDLFSASSRCSCSGIATSDSKPFWVTEGDSNDDYFHYSSGIEQCNEGTETADVKARRNLMASLKSSIASRINMVIQRNVDSSSFRDARNTVSVDISTNTSKNMEQYITQEIMESLENFPIPITDRWIDQDACLVYSRARINKKDWEDAKNLVETEYRYTPINNRISTESDDDQYGEILKSYVRDEVGKLRENSEYYDTEFLLEVSSTIQKNKNMKNALWLTLDISLKWLGNGETLDEISSRPSKGASSRGDRNIMIKNAIVEALDDLRDKLATMLKRSYNKIIAPKDRL